MPVCSGCATPGAVAEAVLTANGASAKLRNSLYIQSGAVD
jgi:hypothetical protein